MAKKNSPGESFSAAIDHFISTQRPVFSLSNRLWNPPTDIYEAEDRAVIRMEIAGVAKENLHITAHDRKLFVRGRRCAVPGEEMVSCHLMEVRYGEFERIFEFPFRVRMDDVKASYEQGFLVIEIPKHIPTRVKVAIQTAESA
ncbi:Hsp20/alpha crystallin family protein [Candidatus Sumerlaeota bacterium]|nr:Hsp20/alpha crystallin family protein [Candidatus Sumerlaeota bacterium]